MMMRPITTTLLLTMSLTGLLGACGGSGNGGGGSGSEEAEGGGAESGQALFDWVECMGGEGVDLPEPTRDANGDLVITGGGVSIGGDGEQSFGANSEEEMQAASEVCGGPPMRAPGVLGEESAQEEEDRLLEFSRCMREKRPRGLPRPRFLLRPGRRR